MAQGKHFKKSNRTVQKIFDLRTFKPPSNLTCIFLSVRVNFLILQFLNLKKWNLAYLITAPVILKTGPSRIRRGPVKIQKEHHIELPTISKYQDTTFMTKFDKLQMAPDAESNFMM